MLSNAFQKRTYMDTIRCALISELRDYPLALTLFLTAYQPVQSMPVIITLS